MKFLKLDYGLQQTSPLFFINGNLGYKLSSSISKGFWFGSRSFTYQLNIGTPNTWVISLVGWTYHYILILSRRNRSGLGSKVCVEIEANSPLPMTISIELRKGVYLEVKVVYPWKPQSCVNCKIFGHSVSFMPVKE